MNEYFGDFLLDTAQPFFFYKDSEVSYGTPDVNADRDGYAAHIELLPLLSGPEVFGLHSNAEIDYLTTASATILSNIIELQPRTAASGSGASRESVIGNVAADITTKLPEAFDLPKLKKMLPLPSPTQVCIFYHVHFTTS
jgi:dynein heavy chain